MCSCLSDRVCEPMFNTDTCTFFCGSDPGSYSLSAALLVHRSGTERGLVHYQGAMNNTAPPESTSGVVHTPIVYAGTSQYRAEEEKSLPEV